MIFIANIYKKFILFIFILTIFISIFFIPVIQSSNFPNQNIDYNEIISVNPNGFVWPIPGYTSISSPFGKRISPTAGASSFHYGCDIPAPQGTKLIAITDGTITLSFSNFKVTYCHVDPNFIVSVGDSVKQGQVIGYVGPKNVYGVPR